MTNMMLQKNLGCYFSRINGSMKEQKMNKFSSSYLCLVVFRGAMKPLSSLELINFSNNNSKFKDLDCKLVGLSRDSPAAGLVGGAHDGERREGLGNISLRFLSQSWKKIQE
jgi:alkyl hydroperoxide reductase subunit AhpC